MNAQKKQVMRWSYANIVFLFFVVLLLNFISIKRVLAQYNCGYCTCDYPNHIKYCDLACTDPRKSCWCDPACPGHQSCCYNYGDCTDFAACGTCPSGYTCTGQCNPNSDCKKNGFNGGCGYKCTKNGGSSSSSSQQPTNTPTPIPPTPTPTDIPPIGSFDNAGCSISTPFSGWACDPNDPQDPVNVNVYKDALLTGTPQTGLSGPNCGGYSNTGWQYYPSICMFDGASHTYAAKAVDNQTGIEKELSNSPKTFTCSVPPPSGGCGAYVPGKPGTAPITWNWSPQYASGLQVWSGSSDPNNPGDTWYFNGWTTPPTTVNGIPAGINVYARTAYNFTCSFSSVSGPVNCPVPTLYPTAAITGYLNQYLGVGWCYQNIESQPQINITPDNSQGFSQMCTSYPGNQQQSWGSYLCTAGFNNQINYVTPAQNLHLSAQSQWYQSAYWTQPNNTCTINANNIQFVDVSSGQPQIFNKDIYFSQISSNAPWIKLKNGFYTSSNSLNNVIPLTVLPYDAEDTCSGCKNNIRYFIVSDPGVDAVVSAQGLYLGNAYPDYVSPRDWSVVPYNKNPAQFYESTFLSYVQSRKQYTSPSQFNSDLSGIGASGIYYFNRSSSTITNDAIPPNYNTVLIFSGDVTISGPGGLFNVYNKPPPADTPIQSLAIVAGGKITFDPSLKEAGGIFIANSIDTGSASYGLKIKGNIVSTSAISMNRSQPNNAQPSLFIVAYPTLYINLLPYLSVATYTWQQLQ